MVSTLIFGDSLYNTTFVEKLSFMQNLLKRSFVLLFLILLNLTFKAQTPACFEPRADYAVGYSQYGVCSGDFNLDGNLDLATANPFAVNVSVMLGSSTGTFGAATVYTVVGGPLSITCSDFNNDGNLDIALPNSSAANFSILLGSATGSFAPAVNYTLFTIPYSVSSGDLNNDGNNDLVFGNAANVSVLLGTGVGTFSPGITYVTGNAPQSISISDFNNDGKLDLATANFYSDNISILLGTGTGSFSAAVNYSVGTQPRCVIAADVNADGRKDLVSANGASNNVSVLLGSGTGTFSSAVNFTVSSIPYSVTSGDFNGDGKLDLAAANYGSAKLSIILGNGAGSFGTPTNYAISNGGTGVLAKDFNHDSKVDIAVCNNNSTTLNVFLQSTAPTLTVSSGVICRGQSYTFTPTGALTNTYTYSSGSSVNSPTNTTTYTVSATAVNGCTNAAFPSITVNANPTVTVNSGTICSGQSFTMIPGGAVTYTFSGGSAVVSPTSNTTYSVSGTNVKGCIASVISSITVNSILLTVNSGSICIGNTFTISPGGASTYTYSGGSAIVSPTVNTTYTITGRGVNTCSSSVISTVTVNSAADIDAITGSLTNCIGTSNIYSITPVTDAINYNWLLPSELTGSAANTNSVSVTPAGNALAVSVLSVNVTNACGTSNTQTISIYISTPSSQFISSQTTVCANSSVTISATNDNANIVNYNWSTASQTICSSGTCNVITDYPSETTTYSLTVTDAYNCTQTYQYTMNTIPTPTVFATTNNTLLCTGNSATLTAVGADTYSWSSGSSASEEVVSPVTTTDYTVTGTDVNGCSNTAVVTQSVSLCTGVKDLKNSVLISIYPNPNDGILNIDMTSLPENCKADIYNTLGELVQSRTFNSQYGSMNITGLPKGIYTIKITESNRVIVTQKIVKE